MLVRRVQTRSEAARVQAVVAASGARMQLRSVEGRKRVVRAKPEVVDLVSESEEDKDGGEGEEDGGDGEGTENEVDDKDSSDVREERNEDGAPVKRFVLRGEPDESFRPEPPCRTWYMPPEFFEAPVFPPGVVEPQPVTDVAAFVNEQLAYATEDERREDKEVPYFADNLPEVRPLPQCSNLDRDVLHAILESVRPELNQVCLGQRPSWRHNAFCGGLFNERDKRTMNDIGGWLHPATWMDVQRWVLGTEWPIPFRHAPYARYVTTYCMEVLVPEAAIRVMVHLERHRPRQEVLEEADMALRRRYRRFPRS